MATSSEALKSGDLTGALGLSKFNFGVGTFGDILIWVLLSILVIGVLCGILVWIYYRRQFSQTILIFGLVGNVPTLKMTDKAKIVRFGMAGDMLFSLQKRQKFISPPTIQMGPRTWWYWERKDGEMINFSLGDIDYQMRKAGAYYVDTDMRMQRLGIEKNLRDRFQKVGFWQKYGTTIVGALFVIMVTVSLVVLFAKLIDVSKALESTASAIRDMSETVNKFYDVKLQGQSPTSSLQPANPPTGGGG